MSCCAPGAEEAGDCRVTPVARDELLAMSRDLGDGLHETRFNVPGVHCGACIATVEREIGAMPGVEHARLNLSARRLLVVWRDGAAEPERIPEVLGRAGYSSFVASPQDGVSDPALRELLVALGVAGFAAGNIMLLSVSVWSGADGATRDLFHWISAMIALPAIVFAGRPFFRPAFAALRQFRFNMDVPIAIGVTLAAAMSLYETAKGGHTAWFDASVTLLFFLLIGRTLDHVMRNRAQGAVRLLARMMPAGATALRADGAHEYIPLQQIEPGMRLHIAMGERLPVDAIVSSGASEFDLSIANGESEPVPVEAGTRLPAGALNLSGPVAVEARAAAKDSFIAEMMRLMEAAESSRAGYRRLADRASEMYAPVVHIASLATFIGWVLAGMSWNEAANIAIAVLIITCPCALGLAVPVVQVVAASRLYARGIMMRNGEALEKLAQVDAAAFDKTGTLTLGRPRLAGNSRFTASTLAIAAALARESRHPYSRAIAEAGSGAPAGCPLAEIREIAGCGIEARANGDLLRLGRPQWALETPDENDSGGVVLSRDGAEIARFRFDDSLRAGAADSVAALRDAGIASFILSGDEAGKVAPVAREAGIDAWKARLTPAQKLAELETMREQGHKVLMVGDGVNDAPALAAAHVSMAPSNAADIGRNAADFVFLREELTSVSDALHTARGARRLILQNFAIAIGYNMIAVPFAMAGYATPLLAALAMSSSSILVISNALRLALPGRRQTGEKAGAVAHGAQVQAVAR